MRRNSGAPQPLEVILTTYLKRIKSASSRRHKDLRTRCDIVLEEVGKAQQLQIKLSVDRYFDVFELSLSSEDDDVAEAAMEGLYKLVADGWVKKDTMVERPGVKGKVDFADVVVDTVLATCRPEQVEEVRAQCLRCLVAAVQSTEIEVHGERRLVGLAKLLCDNYLMTTSTAKHAVAFKAACNSNLICILQTTLARMEQFALSGGVGIDGMYNGVVTNRRGSASVHHLRHHHRRNSSTASDASDASGDGMNEMLTGTAATAALAAAVAAFPSPPRSGAGAGAGGQGRPLPPLPPAAPAVVVENGGGQLGSSSHHSKDSSGHHSKAGSGVNENGFTPARNSVSGLPPLPPGSVVTATSSSASAAAVAASLLHQEDIYGGADLRSPESCMYPEVFECLNFRAQEIGDGLEGFPSVHHRDAYLLFLFLNRLSIGDEDLLQFAKKPYPPAASEATKILGLTHVLTMLESSGTAFRDEEKLVEAMRAELCSSLMHNCTSTCTPVISLSLRIFVCLMSKFKDFFKSEMEVFITGIFLKLLESDVSAHEQKMLVLEVFTGLCKDPQTLVEMFINYDCDLEAIDLFKRVVTAIAKVAKWKSLASDAGVPKSKVAEVAALRMKAIEIMVAISQSLVKAAHLDYGGAFSTEALVAASAAATVASSASQSPPTSRSPSATPPGRRATNPQPQIGGFAASDAPGGTGTGSASAHSPAVSPPASGAAVGGGGGGAASPTFSPGQEAGGSGSGLPSGEGGASAANGVVAATATPAGQSTSSGGSGAGGGAPRTNSSTNLTTMVNGVASTAAGGGGNVHSSETAREQFDLKRNKQQTISTGILKFNINPKKGLAYLQEKGHLDANNPKQVANFLLECSDRLNKTVVGDFLGREREYLGGFCVQVLHEYVDSLHLTDMVFDEAIRHFLAGFRLPGEAQKIDRIMEKFAERFCLQNPGVFPNPDTAFILAFSVIMLNTDLHNPSIPDAKRMTKEGFIKNNKGISEQGRDLSEGLLGGIYDRIQKAPISLKEDDLLRKAVAVDNSVTLQELLPFKTAAAARREKEAVAAERKEMLKGLEDLMRRKQQQGAHHKIFVGLSSPRDMVVHAEPMFNITWGPILTIFAQVLETEDDTEMVALVLDAIKAAIRVAGGLDMSTARKTLTNSLARFTLLQSPQIEMMPKNIMCINALVGLGLTDGNLLKDSWGLLLRCISQLSRLQLVGCGVDTDDQLFMADLPADDGRGNKGGDWQIPFLKDIKGAFSFNDGSAGGGGMHGGGGGGGIRGSRSGGGTGSTALVKSSPPRGRSSKGGMGMGARRGPGREVMGYMKEKELLAKKRREKKEAEKPSDIAKFFLGTSKGEQLRAVEELNAMAVTEGVDQQLIDRVFSESSKLSREAIKDFVQQLVLVSRSEIPQMFGTEDPLMDVTASMAVGGPGGHFNSTTGGVIGGIGSLEAVIFGSSGTGGGGGGGGGSGSVHDPPAARLFSIQKLVEVAEYNMNVRSRMDWASMWHMLADHFSTVGGTKGNSQASMYAMDCLRQLALKFLNKEELRDFNFQRVFLGPFEEIMRNSEITGIRELCVRCVDSLTLARGDNIRSGWATLLKVLELAAFDGGGEDIVRIASRVIDRLVGESFLQLRYDLMPLIQCLLALTMCAYQDICLMAIGHLRRCTRALASGEVDIHLQRQYYNGASGAIVRGRSASGSAASGGSAAIANGVGGSGGISGNGDDDGAKRDNEEKGGKDKENKDREKDRGEGKGTEGRLILQPLPDELAATEDEEKKLQLQVWWPLLAGVAKCISDRRLDVRSAAISTLREAMIDAGTDSPETTTGSGNDVVSINRIGAIFDSRATKLLFEKVLFPPMINVPSDTTITSRFSSAVPTLGNHFPLYMDSWVATTVPQLFQTFVDIYIKTFAQSKECLPSLLEFFGWYTCQEGEVVARLAVQAIHHLVEGLSELQADAVKSGAYARAAGARSSPRLAEEGEEEEEYEASLAAAAAAAAAEGVGEDDGPNTLIPSQLWTCLCDGLLYIHRTCLVRDFGKWGFVLVQTADSSPSSAQAVSFPPASPPTSVSPPPSQQRRPPPLLSVPASLGSPERAQQAATPATVAVTNGGNGGGGGGNSGGGGGGGGGSRKTLPKSDSAPRLRRGASAVAVGDPSRFNARLVMTHMVVVLRLQQIAYDTLRLNIAWLEEQQVASLLGVLEQGCEHASDFNHRNNDGVRFAMHADGFLNAMNSAYACPAPTASASAASAFSSLLGAASSSPATPTKGKGGGGGGGGRDPHQQNAQLQQPQQSAQSAQYNEQQKHHYDPQSMLPHLLGQEVSCRSLLLAVTLMLSDVMPSCTCGKDPSSGSGPVVNNRSDKGTGAGKTSPSKGDGGGSGGVDAAPTQRGGKKGRRNNRDGGGGGGGGDAGDALKREHGDRSEDRDGSGGLDPELGGSMGLHGGGGGGGGDDDMGDGMNAPTTPLQGGGGSEKLKFRSNKKPMHPVLVTDTTKFPCYRTGWCVRCSAKATNTPLSLPSPSASPAMAAALAVAPQWDRYAYAQPFLKRWIISCLERYIWLYKEVSKLKAVVGAQGLKAQKDYAFLLTLATRSEELRQLNPVVLVALAGLESMREDRLQVCLSYTYPLLVELIEVDNQRVRVRIKAVFMNGVRKLLSI